MTVKLSSLIHLYPQSWQRRYGTEMRELLAGSRFSVRAAADLIAGAIDARLYPQTAASNIGTQNGVSTMTKAFSCVPSRATPAEAWRGAAWMIGGSLVLTAIGIGLKLQIGPNAFSEGLLYSSFPAALMLSTESGWCKRYSPGARAFMSGGGALLVILIIWVAVLIANRI